MDQGHGGVLFNTELGQSSFPLRKQGGKRNYFSVQQNINSKVTLCFSFCVLTACFAQQRVCSFTWAEPL